MILRRKFLLTILSLLILGALVAVAYSRSETVREAVYQLWRTNSSKIDSLVQSAALIGLALVLGSIWLRKRGPTLEVKPAVRLWLIGFFASMLIVGSFIVYINPRDIYPTRFFPDRAPPSRHYKTELYPQLDYAPDIVVFGSSRAWALNDEHMQAALGLRLFNAAVSSGSILEDITFARFMEATAATTTPFPDVLLVEVTPGEVRDISQQSSTWPPTIFPYMDRDMLADALHRRITAVVSIARFSESFLIIRRSTDTDRDGYTILPDGSASRPLASASELNALIDTRIDINRNVRWCDAVDPGFSNSIDTIIETADAHHSAVIFYFSPRDPRFFEETMTQNPTYQGCADAYSAYLDSLSQTHDNVFFVDYIDPNLLHLQSIP
ncbi:MAG: hypothetical protein H7175_15525, partial [Burkholderiales bacterium]|nr:hypothetical protein [Anaerolineae bacterium]